MVILMIMAAIALAGAAIGWATRDDDSATETTYDQEYYQAQPESTVQIEKHREYDEDTRTLTETVTTRKVFQDIDPWELDEEE